MRRQFKYFAAAASLLTLMTACTADKLEAYYGQPNPNPETPDNAISFGTYMGKSGTTRAGYEGAITTDKLKEYSTTEFKTNGFGVFAYFTGTDTYGQFQKKEYTGETGGKDHSSAEVANFMFNQNVHWDNSLAEEYITKWTYSPVKYWPNEISGTANTPDDDQDNDQSNNQATGSGTYGGNVSFFAYAPYVDFYGTGGSENLKDYNTSTDATYGIIAINGKTKNHQSTKIDNANSVGGDPKITYAVNPNGNKIVDLLWGTMSTTDPNVTSTTNQAGVSHVAGTNTYKNAILNGYTMNADLTKQKTTGTIGFAFKHALAKVGGSTKTGDGDASSDKFGLLVQLDLDNMKGAETGGEKADDTKVTIKDIKIEARALVENDGKKPSDAEYVPSYLKKQQGVLNLATGKWDVSTEAENLSTAKDATTANVNTARTEATATTLYITSPASSDEDKGNKSGEIATTLQETSSTPDSWDAIQNGVQTTAQNVYKEEANPLVFIPGTYPELIVTVDYIVRTKDDNLYKGWSEVGQKITKKLTFTKAVELNKQYSLLMHLGLTSVKFTASVSDWDVNSDDPNFDSDGNGVNDIHIDEVYLPRNVAS